MLVHSFALIEYWSHGLVHHYVGVRDELNRLPMPPISQLSSEFIRSNGLHLIHNALGIYLWVGRAYNPASMQDLFGVSSYDQLVDGQVMTFLFISLLLCSLISLMCALYFQDCTACSGQCFVAASQEHC
eukprot:m.600626 g.600626  ORF g.600626 m.600626 type:complete len:129 (+) comp58084_c0_seq17:3053-3439(+)